MSGKFRQLTATALAVAALGGCAETTLPQATGKGTINAINAMPGSPVISFLIEERLLGTINYKAALGAQPFDDLTFNFNFEFTPPGASEPTRIATQFIDLLADTAHTLVITGSVSAPAVMQWEIPVRDWAAEDTVFQMGFAHLAAGLGDVDVYVAAPGTLPVLGEERAKLSPGGREPEMDFETGDYEIIITPRDDPATVLYQSAPTPFAAQVTYLTGIFDPDPSITGSVSVRRFTDAGASVELADPNVPPTLRTIHAAFGTESIDIYGDEALGNLIFSNLGFGESTGDLAVSAGSNPYTFTAVGNPGAIIHEESLAVLQGRRVGQVLVGMPASLQRIILNENRRPLETSAKVRVVHAAANLDLLDLYIVDTGTGISDVDPVVAGMPFTFASDFQPQLAGNFDFIVTLPGEKDPLAMLQMLQFSNGDVSEILIFDNVDPAIADMVLNRF